MTAAVPKEDGWDAVAARAFTGAPEQPPTGVVPPPVPEAPPPLEPGAVPLILTDHFDLTMVDVPPRGAMLLVRQLARPDAMELVRQYRPPTLCLNERGQSQLERELALEPGPRPSVRHGTRLLVMQAPRWNDVRWFLVSWESDGDGCIP